MSAVLPSARPDHRSSPQPEAENPYLGDSTHPIGTPSNPFDG